MIQRKQTLFLFQLIFLGIALLFVSVYTVVTANTKTDVYLAPLSGTELVSTGSHWVAIALNFLALVLAFVTIFLYKKRELQLKMTYVLAALWVLLTILIAATPFVLVTNADVVVEKNHFGTLISVVGVIASWFAARYIKKDIELLKSADRIR